LLFCLTLIVFWVQYLWVWSVCYLQQTAVIQRGQSGKLWARATHKGATEKSIFTVLKKLKPKNFCSGLSNHYVYILCIYWTFMSDSRLGVYYFFNWRTPMLLHIIAWMMAAQHIWLLQSFNVGQHSIWHCNIDFFFSTVNSENFQGSCWSAKPFTKLCCKSFQQWHGKMEKYSWNKQPFRWFISLYWIHLYYVLLYYHGYIPFTLGQHCIIVVG